MQLRFDFVASAWSRLALAVVVAGLGWAAVESIEYGVWTPPVVIAAPAPRQVTMQIEASRAVRSWTVRFDGQIVNTQASTERQWQGVITSARTDRGGVLITAELADDDGQDWALRVQLRGAVERDVTAWVSGDASEFITWKR